MLNFFNYMNFKDYSWYIILIVKIFILNDHLKNGI